MDRHKNETNFPRSESIIAEVKQRVHTVFGCTIQCSMPGFVIIKAFEKIKA